jgi:hypothetical protein
VHLQLSQDLPLGLAAVAAVQAAAEALVQQVQV